MLHSIRLNSTWFEPHDYGYNIDLTNNSQVQVDYGIQQKWV